MRNKKREKGKIKDVGKKLELRILENEKQREEEKKK